MRHSLSVVLVIAFCAGCRPAEATAPSDLQNKAGAGVINDHSDIQHLFVNGTAYCLLSGLDSSDRRFRCSSLKDDSPLEIPTYSIEATENVPSRIFSARSGDICGLYKIKATADSNEIVCWRYMSDGSTNPIKMKSEWMGDGSSQNLLSIAGIDARKWSFSMTPEGRLTDGRRFSYDLSLSAPQDIAAAKIEGWSGSDPRLLYTIDSKGLEVWNIQSHPQESRLEFKKFETSPPQVRNPKRIVVNPTDNDRTCVLGQEEIKCWKINWWDNQTFEVQQGPRLRQPKELVPHRYGFCALDSTGVSCWTPVSPPSSPSPVLKLKLGEIFGPRNEKLINPDSLIADWGRFCVHDEGRIKCWTEASMASD